MTLTTLKLLKRGEALLWAAPAGHPYEGNTPPLSGRVNAADGLMVEVFWEDGTTSVLWLRHVIEGRETRHTHWSLDPRAEKNPGLF